jgi:hypothetical protein
MGMARDHLKDSFQVLWMDLRTVLLVGDSLKDGQVQHQLALRTSLLHGVLGIQFVEYP